VLAFNTERAMQIREGKMVDMTEQDWRDKHVFFLATVK
jgi:hypothetical protein